MADYTGTGPLDREKLEALRARLARMSNQKLQQFYNACLHMCRLDRGQPPQASYVQQLVQTWRELERRRKSRAAG